MIARFVQVDVFTDRVFGGNSLAVFPEGANVPPELMQLLAREMNLSETTYVLPPDDAEDVANIRIFTPGAELPFAGHPTIGTAYVLAVEGSVDIAEFSFHERVGRIPVRIEGELHNPNTVWMTQPLPVLEEPVENRDGIAGRLGVGVGDLLDIPIRTASAGVPFLFVGLRTPEAVDRVSLADRDLAGLPGRAGAGQGVFVFAPIDGLAREVHSRMLGSHGLGIVEDPATGGASGPLGALLVHEGVVPMAETVDIVSRQGVAMGRPSEVFIHLMYSGIVLRSVEVGGSVVPVLDGTVRL